MTIIGLDNLLEICTDFVNEIDDFEDVQVDTEFQCFPLTNEIFISLVASQMAVDEFMHNLMARTSVRDISEFTWSLLHEVGHCETWSRMSNRTTNHCRNIKRKITRGSIPTIIYYTLTDERIATDWAIKYIENNHEAVKRFDREVLAILGKIFEENDIE